ncbi:hypothetical protein STEG23_022836, partial [Scotinomys teguina]
DPAVVINHGDPVVIVPQEPFLHATQKVIDGADVKLGQPRAQDVVVPWAIDIITEPSCDGTMDLEMVLDSSLGQDVTMGSTDHSDWHDPNGTMAFGHQYGPKRQPRLLALVLPLMTSGATNINTDAGHSRASNPDVAFDNSPGLNDIMSPGDSTGHTQTVWPWQQHGPQAPT